MLKNGVGRTERGHAPPGGVASASEFLRRPSSGRKDVASQTSSPTSSPTLSSNYNSPSFPSGLLRKLLSVDEDAGPPRNYSKFSTWRFVQDNDGRRRTTQGSWYPLNSPVSALILLLFFLFLGALGVVYVNKTSVDTLSFPRDVDYPTCDDRPNQIPDVNCVKDEDRTYVDLMLNIILAELADRLADNPCSSSIALSDNQLLKVIKRKDKTLSYYVLNNIKIILKNNPKWNIKPTSDGIELINIPQHLYCTSISYVTVIAGWVIKISVLFLLSLAVFEAARWWIRREARYKEIY